jgi:hypothetical protein
MCKSNQRNNRPFAGPFDCLRTAGTIVAVLLLFAVISIAPIVAAASIFDGWAVLAVLSMVPLAVLTMPVFADDDDRET